MFAATQVPFRHLSFCGGRSFRLHASLTSLASRESRVPSAMSQALVRGSRRCGLAGSLGICLTVQV